MIRLAAILSLIAVAIGLLTAGWVSGSLVLVDVSIALAGLALLIWLVAVAIWRENAFGPPAAERRPQRQALTALPEALSPVASAIAGAGRKAKSAVGAVAPAAQQRPVDRSRLPEAAGRERREQELASRPGDQKRTQKKGAKPARAPAAARTESTRQADDRNRRGDAAIRGETGSREEAVVRADAGAGGDAGARGDTAAWTRSSARGRDGRADKRGPDKVAAQSGSTETRPAPQRSAGAGPTGAPPFRASRVLPGPDIVEPRVPEPEHPSEPTTPRPESARPSQPAGERTRPAGGSADGDGGKGEGEIRKPGTVGQAAGQAKDEPTVTARERGQSPASQSPGAKPAGKAGAGEAGADKADGASEAEQRSESSAPAAGSANGSSASGGSANGSLVSVVPGIARYHKAECILIRFLGDDDVERMSVQEAEAADCAPCRACRPDKVEAAS